jgi:uncharacterized membrane protein YphA (DoxX/SURF4 family)
VEIVQTAPRRPMLRDFAGTAGRLLLGGVLLYAGLTKIGDPAASIRAVKAYQILSGQAAEVVGAALPMIEIALGLLLLAGLATRVAAGASAVLLGCFVTGVISAWARGLRIDCGCFGGGGQLGATESPDYGLHIARNVALLAIAGFLIIRPRTRLSVDAHLA